MSACTSSLTSASCQCPARLERAGASSSTRAWGCRRALVDVLSCLPDARAARGRRHALASVLLIAACAVMTGARSYVAIWQWATDLPSSERTELGLDGPVPSESTIRRILQASDADLLDAVLAAWAAARRAATTQAPRSGLHAIAVDGKTCRGARTVKGPAVHLLGVVDHHSGAVLAQGRVEATTGEVQAFRPVLDHLDLTGVVVTADALHTQRAHVHYLHRHGARYVFIVKGNQPKLATQLAALPWAQVPTAHEATTKAHGRIEHRELKLTRVRAGIAFPHARLAVQITRTRRHSRGQTKTSREVVYAVTDLDYQHVTPAQIADLVRGHWAIENRLHWVRDVTFDEDRSQVRTGTAAHVMATLRNLAITVHRHAGATNIAHALRAVAHRPARLLALIR